MYNQFYNDRLEQLHQQNQLIHENQYRLSQIRKPFLDEILDDGEIIDQKLQEVVPQSSGFRPQSSGYKIKDVDLLQSNMLQSQMKDVNSVIQDHHLRASQLQRQYLTREALKIDNEEKPQNYKQVQRKLSERFNIVATKLQKDQKIEDIKFNNIKKPVLKSKEEVQKIKKQEEQKKLNNFVEKMTNKYSQYLHLANKQEMNLQNKTKLQLHEERFVHYQMDKEIKDQHQEAMIQKEKPVFNRKPSAKVGVPLTISHQVIDNSQQQDMMMLDKILADNETELQKRAHDHLFFKILYERQKMIFSTLQTNKKKIAFQMWQDMDKNKIGIVKKSEIQQYFDSNLIFQEMLNFNVIKLKKFLTQQRTKQIGFLTQNEFIGLIQNKKITMSEAEILEDIEIKYSFVNIFELNRITQNQKKRYPFVLGSTLKKLYKSYQNRAIETRISIFANLTNQIRQTNIIMMYINLFLSNIIFLTIEGQRL